MQKIDTLVVGALETAQTPVSFQEIQALLPADHVFLTLWPQMADIAILHPLQALNIVEQLDAALDKPGDVIECGVFQGVTSVLMAKLMDIRQSDKKLFLFDSFQGLPEPDRQKDASQRFRKGAWCASRDEVENLLAKYNVLPRCEIHEGWFADTLPRLPAGQRFCFAYIDADLHASTQDCLRELWPRLGQGCAAVFDDYHHPSGGVHRALDAWVADTGEIIHAGPASQCVVIRGMDADNAGVKCHRLDIGNGRDILISFDQLQNNRLFCSVLSRRLKYMQTYVAHLTQYAGLVGISTPPPGQAGP